MPFKVQAVYIGKQKLAILLVVQFPAAMHTCPGGDAENVCRVSGLENSESHQGIFKSI